MTDTRLIPVGEEQARSGLESCRRWKENDRCGQPAEFIVWGKLFDPEHLGPRCYDCAAEQIGHNALYPNAGYAVLDLRPLRSLADSYEDGLPVEEARALAADESFLRGGALVTPGSVRSKLRSLLTHPDSEAS